MQATAAIRNWGSEVLAGWNRFWFRPSDPATLGLIRICAGAMMLYTHLVWSLDLTTFIGPTGWLTREAVGSVQEGTYSWSYLWWIEDSPALLWTAHVAALVAFAMLTVGLLTRVAAVLSLVAVLAYVQRLTGALFGLDQINVMLALYLAIGPSGDAFSLDRWLKRRKTGVAPPVRWSWTANLTVRLIQLHMCVIYLFAGLAKLTGQAWWDGTALWMAFGNMEYQSMDMTWMANHPYLINVMTHVTVFWEIFYCALIWPRLSRPVMLVLAVPLHMGIAICLGMITFGLAMLIGNLAFLSPAFVRAVLVRKPAAEQGRAGGARPSASTKRRGKQARAHVPSASSQH
ncbi:MAG: HTTM domain-containing protein [Planctomycetota bacterium]|nr:MAG: HTTM domain-containing protein [Planctomycetota bacterium]